MHLDSAGKVELLSLGLRRLVPFLQDFGEGRTIDLDKLLKFVQVISKLLEALFESGELGRQSRYALAAGLEDLLLVQQSLKTDFELCHISHCSTIRRGEAHLGLFL